MAIQRQKRPLTRNAGENRDASLFIVATEGEKTEPHYLSMFKSRRLKVEVLKCEDGRSSPDAVFERLSVFANKYQFGVGDSFWLLVDRDRWHIKTLSNVASECRRKGFSLLISNPNFEIWLSLHFSEPLPNPMTRRALERHLKKLLGSYTKGSFPLDGLLVRSHDACERARQIDDGSNAIWPVAPGSRAYELISKIHTLL